MKYNIQLLAATIIIQKYMRMAQARILVARMKQKAIDEILFKAACLIQTRVRRSQAKIKITRLIRNKALSKAGTFKKNVFVSKFETSRYDVPNLEASRCDVLKQKEFYQARLT